MVKKHDCVQSNSTTKELVSYGVPHALCANLAGRTPPHHRCTNFSCYPLKELPSYLSHIQLLSLIMLKDSQGEVVSVNALIAYVVCHPEPAPSYYPETLRPSCAPLVLVSSCWTPLYRGKNRPPRPTPPRLQQRPDWVRAVERPSRTRSALREGDASKGQRRQRVPPSLRLGLRMLFRSVSRAVI